MSGSPTWNQMHRLVLQFHIFFGGGGMHISDEAKFFAPQSKKCSDCKEEMVILE